MRITITLLATVILGTIIGSAMAAWSFFRYPEYEYPEQIAVAETELGEKYPSVEVAETQHDFGSMDSNASDRHEFIFRNNGDSPLTLEAGKTTCKCTLSDIGEGTILPGESAAVTVEWSGKGLVGPYTQTATILTNDPRKRKVDLRVKGTMTAKTRMVPDTLVFSSVSAGHSAQGDVRIYGYLDDPIEITGCEVDDPEQVDVTISPMSSEEVEGEEYATCGHRVSVTLKPGLPPGPFETKIRVKTNVEGLKELFIPVDANIYSEISVFGPGWSSKRGVLRFGTLGKAKASRRLLLRVGGAQPEKVKFEVADVHPDYVKVRLDEKTSPPGSRVAVTPIEIEIPEGSPPGNFRDPRRHGHVRLKVANATVPELDIRLEYIIGG